MYIIDYTNKFYGYNIKLEVKSNIFTNQSIAYFILNEWPSL